MIDLLFSSKERAQEKINSLPACLRHCFSAKRHMAFDDVWIQDGWKVSASIFGDELATAFVSHWDSGHDCK